jgi:hypothetical protein
LPWTVLLLVPPRNGGLKLHAALSLPIGIARMPQQPGNA